VLSRLYINSFRNISEITIEELATVNVVLGPNGAGKTSLFEAIFTLAHGRSFRRFGGKRDSLVSLSAEQLIVYGEAIGVKQERLSMREAGVADDKVNNLSWVRHKIGLSKSRVGETRIKRNGAAVKRLSEITELLPIIAINADTFDLLSGPPQERRSFLDWSVFHVEHSYKDDVRAFARALAQRNALLRSSAREGAVDQTKESARLSPKRLFSAEKTVKSELAIWTDALAHAGERLDFQRREVFRLLNREFKKVSSAIGLESFSLSLSYRRGWDAKSDLVSALCGSEEVDAARGFTSVGPHRCDIQITIEIDGQRRLARDVMSRGQLKLTIFALKLSQLSLLQGGIENEGRHGQGGEKESRDLIRGGESRGCLLLLDDVAAELDPKKLQALGAIISALKGVQVFVNGTTEILLSSFLAPFEARSLQIKKFHVEHGCLR
jgi:DNA replication and repair protein RecF